MRGQFRGLALLPDGQQRRDRPAELGVVEDHANVPCPPLYERIEDPSWIDACISGVDSDAVSLGGTDSIGNGGGIGTTGSISGIGGSTGGIGGIDGVSSRTGTTGSIGSGTGRAGGVSGAGSIGGIDLLIDVLPMPARPRDLDRPDKILPVIPLVCRERQPGALGSEADCIALVSPRP